MGPDGRGAVLTGDRALLSVAQMAVADRLTVAGGTPVPVLMGAAGSAVARIIADRWSPGRVAVLCGPGDNGGDGFVVARRLAEAGWDVQLSLLGAPDRLTGAAAHNAALWTGPVAPLSPAVLEGATLIVDALFGAGLNRAPDRRVAALLAAAAAQAPIVAIDVPSGVMGDTGADLGAVAASLTITFFRKKPGHVLLPGRTLCGETVVADIGIAPSVLDRIAPQTWENGPDLWRDALPLLHPTGHKYTRGHALVWGGYPMTGAARLATRAAARAGAGLTSVAVPPQALPIYATALTSIMVRPVTGAEDLAALLSDGRITAHLIGPGAGVGDATRSTALAMLATGRAVVLDADALTSFAGDPAALDRAITGPCVMTPHDGEFARLWDTTGDKLHRARAAAARSGAVIVLKGADTVIAAPDGRAIVNTNAPPTLATAGSGDVLAGLVLGLLAQGMDAFDAAAAAVWMHGDAASRFGPGLIADDLPGLLPAVLRGLSA
ncbi:NAD(P)H-hydrate epimerase [Loktanella fryxellensis]|uniref:Bifunctional NAD(P)H-hydrate repair enzyme n=1 Tax=Loktanella fryxellensis TaxID=245187 RepID=A0A1H8HIJ6_9RHOB|nr:NAD(P)H-hydrate dehydratase [Loktanella fryxellensis]SEN55926.1 NAD(P)H-hydrate epimerase [Loktanella fryxellensis]